MRLCFHNLVGDISSSAGQTPALSTRVWFWVWPWSPQTVLILAINWVAPMYWKRLYENGCCASCWVVTTWANIFYIRAMNSLTCLYPKECKVCNVLIGHDKLTTRWLFDTVYAQFASGSLLAANSLCRHLCMHCMACATTAECRTHWRL